MDFYLELVLVRMNDYFLIILIGRYEDELTARLAFVDFDGKEAMTAYHNGEKIDEKFLQKYCMNVVDGINQLKEWVKKH